MNKVIALSVLAMGTATATFADRAAGFGLDRSVKDAPVVRGQLEHGQPKSQDRTPNNAVGIKRASVSQGGLTTVEAKAQPRTPHETPGIKRVNAVADKRENAGFSFAEFTSRFGI